MLCDICKKKLIRILILKKMDNIQKFPAGNSFVTLGAGEMIQGATGADLVLGLIEMKVPFRRQQFSDAALSYQC